MTNGAEAEKWYENCASATEDRDAYEKCNGPDNEGTIGWFETIARVLNEYQYLSHAWIECLANLIHDDVPFGYEDSMCLYCILSSLSEYVEELNNTIDSINVYNIKLNRVTLALKGYIAELLSRHTHDEMESRVTIANLRGEQEAREAVPLSDRILAANSMPKEKVCDPGKRPD